MTFMFSTFESMAISDNLLFWHLRFLYTLEKNAYYIPIHILQYNIGTTSKLLITFARQYSHAFPSVSSLNYIYNSILGFYFTVYEYQIIYRWYTYRYVILHRRLKISCSYMSLQSSGKMFQVTCSTVFTIPTFYDFSRNFYTYALDGLCFCTIFIQNTYL